MSLTEYLKLRSLGRPAEARIFGILRGGFVHEGTFYAHAGSGRGIVQASVSIVTDLRFHAEAVR